MTTPILGLPEISGSQANKYITHNQALAQLEAVTVRALSRTTAAEPVSPAEGDVYILPASPTGTDWSNYAQNDVAYYFSGAWHSYTPAAGLPLWVTDAAEFVVYDGSAWGVVPAQVGDGSLGIGKLSDFDEDASITKGLTWGWQAGRVRNDNAVTDVAAGTLTLTASTTNYVEVTPAGNVSANTSGFTAGRIPLRTVITGASAITRSTDRRTWVTAASGGSGSASISDFSQDTASTTGLTFAYNGGNLRNGSTVIPIASGTVTLTASTTNYIEIDSSGAVSINQTGFTSGQIPLFEIVTGASSITTVTDRRAWLQFAGGDFQSNGSVPMAGNLNMAGYALIKYTERSAAVSSSGTATLDLSTGRLFAVTLAANTTIAFSNVPTSGVTSCTLELIQDATGGRTVTWPASVTWAGGTAPTISSAANALDVVTLYTRDGGTTWRGFLAGAGMA